MRLKILIWALWWFSDFQYSMLDSWFSQSCPYCKLFFPLCTIVFLSGRWKWKPTVTVHLTKKATWCVTYLAWAKKTRQCVASGSRLNHQVSATIAAKKHVYLFFFSLNYSDGERALLSNAYTHAGEQQAITPLLSGVCVQVLWKMWLNLMTASSELPTELTTCSAHTAICSHTDSKNTWADVRARAYTHTHPDPEQVSLQRHAAEDGDFILE